MADLESGSIRIVPGVEESYRYFIPASLALAVFLGFALGIHIAVSRLTGGGNPERNADLVQAHGQVQLLGFAGLYVIGMSLRLLPRFSGARIAFPSLPPFALTLLAGGLAARAIVLPLLAGSAHDVMLLATTAMVLGGSACLFLIIAGTARRSRRPDPSVGAFVCGAAFLLLSSAVAMFEALDASGNDLRTVPTLSNNAILQLQLGGFLMSFIAGVSMRAVPTMAGVNRTSSKAAFLLLACLSTAVIGLAASLLYLEHEAYSSFVAGLGALAFGLLGVAFVSLSWQAGVLRSSRNRLRPASQSHLWLIRSAFAWLAVAGLIALYSGARGLNDGALPGQFDFDAVRHLLGLGVITNLIAGMSLMIVPEFAAQRQHSDQRNLAIVLFVLINLATLLRVAPSIAGTDWSFNQRNLSMAVAGVLAEASVIIFAGSLLRLLVRRQPVVRGGDP